MKSRHTVLGWVVYQVGLWVVRRWIAQNRTKIAAAATVAVVLIGGLLAAKATDGE